MYPGIDNYAQKGRVPKAEAVGVVYRSCRIVAAGSDGRMFEWVLISPGLYRLGDVPVTLDEITTLLARDYKHVTVQDLDEHDRSEGLGKCPYCGRSYK
jgi:hypothetical protein